MTTICQAEVRAIFVAKPVRTFCYGFRGTGPPVYLSELGLSAAGLVVAVTLTLAGIALLTWLVRRPAERYGGRPALIALGALSALAAVILLSSRDPRLVVLAAMLGNVAVGTGETGPFLALEQVRIARAVAAGQRTAALSIYNLLGYAAAALGAATVGALAGYRPLFVVFLAGAVVQCMAYARLPPEALVERRRPVGARLPSASLIRRLAALGALDAFAGGFVLQSLVVYFLHERYSLGLEALGGVFFATQVLTAASLLLAVRAAARFGLLATMVVSHLVSNVVLILIAWAPTAAVAIALLCLRHLLSQMDVPTRQAYVMALVEDHEREAAATTTNIARTVAQAVTPALAEAREARNRLRPAVLDERRPPLEPCQRQHLGDARLGLDEPLHLVGGEEELVNGRAPPVTALGATHAALAPVEDERLVVRVAELRERVLPVRLRELVELGAVRTVFGPTLPAEPLHEPLGEDAQEGVGEVEGIEPHVEETNDRLHGAVRVERAEHEVAGERRLED